MVRGCTGLAIKKTYTHNGQDVNSCGWAWDPVSRRNKVGKADWMSGAAGGKLVDRTPGQAMGVRQTGRPVDAGGHHEVRNDRARAVARFWGVAASDGVWSLVMTNGCGDTCRMNMLRDRVYRWRRKTGVGGARGRHLAGRT